MNSITCRTEQPNGYRSRVVVRAHEIHADLSVPGGGEDTAPGAHDYFDVSLAVCKAHTAMWFAKKNGIPLERVDCDIDRDDTEERQGRYKLIVRLEFHGPLTDEQKTRLYAAAGKCPVSKLMTTSKVIVETAPPAAPR